MPRRSPYQRSWSRYPYQDLDQDQEDGQRFIVFWDQRKVGIQWLSILHNKFNSMSLRGIRYQAGNILLYLLFSTYILDYFTLQFRGSLYWWKKNQYSSFAQSLNWWINIAKFFTLTPTLKFFFHCNHFTGPAGRSCLTSVAPFRFPFSPRSLYFSVLQP